MSKINFKKMMKEAKKGASASPYDIINDVMDSDEFKKMDIIAKRIEDVLNIVLEQQQLLNENLLTYVDYFKEIDARLLSIEEKLTIEKQ